MSAGGPRFRDVVEAVEFHKRRQGFLTWQREEVSALFDITTAHAGATKTPAKGLPGHGRHSRPVIGEPVDTVPGLITTYPLKLADGQALDDLADHAEALRDNFGAHAVRFEKVPPERGLYTPRSKLTHAMHVVSADPLPPDLRWSWSAHASWRTTGRPAVGFAMSELLRPLEMPLTGAHVLVGGKTGSGKSYTMLSLACALAVWQRRAEAVERCVMLCVADPKGSFANTLAGRAAIVARTPKDIDAMFKGLRDYFGARQQEWRTMSPLVWPTTKTPAVWVFIDELASWLEADDDVDRKDRLRLLGDAARTMREAGGVLVIGVQHPYTEILPNSIRGNMSFAICHRMNRAEEVKLVLGPGWQLDVSIAEVQGAGNGEFFYTRDPLAGGPGSEDERGRVLRARGLFLDVEAGEAAAVLDYSRRFMPNPRELVKLYAKHGGAVAA